MNNNINIAIGCNYYNSFPELKRLIDSIPKGFIDYFIGIDGVYRYHKEKNKDDDDGGGGDHLPSSLSSTDGSNELIMNAEHIANRIIYHLPGKLEFEKRNKYLEVCSLMLGEIDVLLIVDSDEFFIYPEATEPEVAYNRFKQNIEKTMMKHKNHNVFSIQGLNLNADPPYDCAHPRVWIHPSEMRYLNGSHYYYGNINSEKKEIETFKKQRYNYVQYSAGIIKGIVLAHSHALRSKEYMKDREDYIEYLKRFEGLTQSFYFTLEQSHRLAMLGINRDQVNINNKDDILRKYNITR